LSPIIDLGTLPGGVSSIARAVNLYGQVVGDSTYTNNPNVSEAFFYDAGQMSALDPFGGGEGQGSASTTRGR
jgi:probable HAF family extracellular repeat protein